MKLKNILVGEGESVVGGPGNVQVKTEQDAVQSCAMCSITRGMICSSRVHQHAVPQLIDR